MVGRLFDLYDEARGIETRTTVIVDQCGTVRFHKTNPTTQAGDSGEILAVLEAIHQATH